jgi:iron complex outermembrane receptor protein
VCSSDLEIIPFSSGRIRYEEVAEARWFTRDKRQPVLRRDRLTNIGPLWASADETNTNHGAVIKLRVLPNWDVDAGLFLATQDRRVNHSILVRDIDQSGIGTREIVSEPPQVRHSWSGEARLTRHVQTGALHHKLIGSYRGRRALGRIGGADRTNLGRFNMNARVDVAKPQFTYGARTLDEVKMDVLSLGYEGTWGQRVAVAGGVQWMNYEKRINQPGLPETLQSDKPMLLNGVASVQVTGGVVAYGAFTQGLEETSAAPPEAVNRNDLLPAQRTEQIEAGLRVRLPGAMTLNVSAFRIKKPLFALDDFLVFRERGALQHQGLEASLAGVPVVGLNVLVGGLFLDASNSGPEVLEGNLGPVPVGRPRLSGRVALNWRPGGTSRWSFDVVVDGEGPSEATRDNLVQSTGGIDIDIGMRYRFKVSEHDATLRMVITEVTNSHRWDVAGDGAWRPNLPRAVTATLTVNI